MNAICVARGAGDQPAGGLQTAPVARGNLVVSVKGTGTAEPVEVVEVGAKVSGDIVSLGPDPRGATEREFANKPIDFSSPVEPGTLLAKIDDAPYQAALATAKADVRAAQAKVELAQAKLDQATAQSKPASAEGGNKTARDAAVQAAELALRTARAEVEVQQAGIEQARAALSVAQMQLDSTRITSPIRGIIIDRRVNIGQLVGAQRDPTGLFLIAADLKRLQAWVPINEADIGAIRAGQRARCTCDALPAKEFSGSVLQVRLNATMTARAVTYTVVIAIDESTAGLLPYMTVNVSVETGRRNGVQVVPNTALYWKPDPKWVAPGVNWKPGDNVRRVWIEERHFVRPIEVKVGATDGSRTELTGGDVKEGMLVIVGGSLPESQARAAPDPQMRQFLSWFGPPNVLALSQQTFPNGAALPNLPSTLTARDAGEMPLQCPTVLDAAPLVTSRLEVSHGRRRWLPLNVVGSTPSYLTVHGWNIPAEGEPLTDHDVASAADVCLVGQTIVREVFDGSPPLGQDLRVGHCTLRVVGVLRALGPSATGRDQDDLVLMPWTTLRFHASDAPPRASNAAIDAVDEIVALVPGINDGPGLEIRQFLRDRHRLRSEQADDFATRDLSDYFKAYLAARRVQQLQDRAGRGN